MNLRWPRNSSKPKVSIFSNSSWKWISKQLALHQISLNIVILIISIKWVDKGKTFSKQGSTNKELQVRLQINLLMQTSVIKKLQTDIQIPSYIELISTLMSSRQLIKKSTTKCNYKICNSTTMSLPSITMNLRSKRAVLKKAPLEFLINFLKTHINVMIPNSQEVMK